MSSLKYEIDFEETSEDGIRYRVVKEKDFDKCIDLWYEVFQKDEPATLALGGLTRHPEITKLVKGYLYDGVSCLAEDTEMGNKPVGIAVHHVFERDETKKEAEANGRFDINNLGHIPWALGCIMALCDIMCYPQDFFDRYPDLNRILYTFSVGTVKEYQNKGIATYLGPYFSYKVHESSPDCYGSLTLVTSDHTRRIADKYGMNIESEIPWDLVEIGEGNFPWRGKQVGSKGVCTIFETSAKHFKAKL